jgi:hypothetical protein
MYTVKNNEGKSNNYAYIKEALLDFYLWTDLNKDSTLIKGNEILLKSTKGEITERNL